jgi:hypothetical protein
MMLPWGGPICQSVMIDSLAIQLVPWLAEKASSWYTVHGKLDMIGSLSVISFHGCWGCLVLLLGEA